MDRLCPALEETHPAFVAGYRESRTIVHVNATRPLSDEELANAVRNLEEKQEAEARKAAVKANQEAEEVQRAAIRQEQEEKLRSAKKGSSTAASQSPLEGGVASWADGDRVTRAPEGVNSGLNS